VVVPGNTNAANQPPVADAEPNHQDVVILETAYFNGTNSYDPDGSIVTYDWDFGDWTTGSGEEVSHAYDTAGLYDVTLTVTDNEGAQSNDMVTVMVDYGPPPDQPPVADAEPNYQEVGIGESALFWGYYSYDPDGGYIMAYDWDFGDGNTDSGDVVSHTYSSYGIYSVTLTVTDDEGDTDTDTVTVNVTDVPGQQPPVADADPDYQEVGVGLDASFDGSNSYDPDGGYIQSWNWDFGDGNMGYGEFVTHAYGSAGTYYVTLTVMDDHYYIDTDTVTVNVTGGPILQPPVADADPNTQSFKIGGTANFDGSNSYDPDGTIVSYDWDFGDGNTGSGVTTSHVYTTDGTFTVTLTVTDNDGLTDTDTCQVTVIPNQPPLADADPNTQTIIIGGTASFDASNSNDPDGTIVSFEWDFGDGNSGVGETPSHVYATHGVFTVTLTVTDDNGATDTDTCEVTVTPTMHVLDIEFENVMGRKKVKSLLITVTIVDYSGAPVEGATVDGTLELHHMNGHKRYYSGDTGSDGTVTFEYVRDEGTPQGDPRRSVRRSEYTFTVDDVVKVGYIYEPGDNVETSETHIV
jgi:PKD repeat protein